MSLSRMGVEERRKARIPAIVAALGTMCIAMLCVGAVSFSRGYFTTGDTTGGKLKGGSSQSAIHHQQQVAPDKPAPSTQQPQQPGLGRKLARRPELKTRSGQLAFARYSLLAEYPHDSEAFTQGLSYYNGYLYESTGLFGGKSSVRRVDPETGHVLQLVKLDAKYFGEGMTILNDEIHSLTWRNRVGFTWDINTLEMKREFPFSTKTDQGWGLTTDGESLIVSDGSTFLFFWDPATMQETRRVEVKMPDGRAVGRINELEMVKGYVFANVWFDDHLYKIDPDTGAVVDIYNFAELYPRALQKQEIKSSEACLNGIAYDPEEDVLYLTGKLWPRMYKVKLNEVKETDDASSPPGGHNRRKLRY